MTFLLLYLLIKKKKSFIIYIISYILGAILFLSRPEFYKFHLIAKTDTSFLNELMQNTSLITEFLNLYFEHVIQNNWVILVMILSFAIFIKLCSKQEQFKYINSIALVIAISILTFELFLIFMGKTHYYGTYWVVHEDLKLLVRFYLLITLFLQMGCIINQRKNLKILVLFLIVMSVICITLVIKEQTFQILNDYNFVYRKMVREEMYKYEKSLLFYLYQNKPAYIKTEEGVFREYPLYVITDSYLFSIYDVKSATYIIALKDDGLYLESDKYEEVNEEERSIKYQFVSLHKEESLDDILKKDGLIFSDEELRKTNFQNLFNKEFVTSKLNLET